DLQVGEVGQSAACEVSDGDRDDERADDQLHNIGIGASIGNWSRHLGRAPVARATGARPIDQVQYGFHPAPTASAIAARLAMVTAILRSTVPLLPVLLATRLSPSTRSVRLPARPGREQQRGERGAGEEQVSPVVLAHLPTSPSSIRSREDAPFAPTAPSG